MSKLRKLKERAEELRRRALGQRTPRPLDGAGAGQGDSPYQPIPGRPEEPIYNTLPSAGAGAGAAGDASGEYNTLAGTLPGAGPDDSDAAPGLRGDIRNKDESDRGALPPGGLGPAGSAAADGSDEEPEYVDFNKAFPKDDAAGNDGEPS